MFLPPKKICKIFPFFLSFLKVVAHILPFRDQNREKLDPLWNQHHVERVEIVLKETVDVKSTSASIWVGRKNQEGGGRNDVIINVNEFSASNTDFQFYFNFFLEASAFPRCNSFNFPT